jgi:GAF domain-containing protein
MAEIRRISEVQRVEVLNGYGLLDTVGELQFDSIVRAASRSFRVPIAAMSLIDAGRLWFKAKTGIDIDQTARSISFCSHAIEQNGILEITDPVQDPRFRDNPLVTGEPNIRYYAGAPIVMRSGAALGAICIIDTQFRFHLDTTEREHLLALARRAAEAIELRQVIRELKL